MRASSVDQTILDVLRKQHDHMTSLQVFEALRQTLPAVNQSTVYRSLERLAKRGVVSISDIGTGASVYELLPASPHHHLVCQECGAMITLNDDEVRQVFSSVETNHNFKIVTRHLVLFGVCQNCLLESGAH